MIDERWGDYVPWFLRYSGLAGAGDFNVFFSRAGQRLERLIRFNEAGVTNIEYFGSCLESETLQRFKHRTGESLDLEIRKYFDPDEIRGLVTTQTLNDPEELAAKSKEYSRTLADLQNIVRGKVEPSEKEHEAAAARKAAQSTYSKRFTKHFNHAVRERLGVIEVLLHMLPATESAVEKLISDLRKYFAEANIPLTIRGNQPLIVPFEEAMLEHEVIGKLLPRLEAQFPERAKELIAVYHDLLANTKTLDSIFSEAFKTLEEIARKITGNASFLFNQSNLEKHFVRLHPTTRNTIINLAAHRGDRAGHARSAPAPDEIRYLLFEICNIALLILDYRRQSSN